MILRFRGKDGMLRVSIEQGASFSDAIKQLEKQLPAHSNLKVASQPNTEGEAASPKWDSDLASLGVKHGDLFFVTYDSDSASSGPAVPASSVPGAAADAAAAAAAASLTTKQDPIDDELDKLDGKIPRKRTNLCKHGERGMCEYCQPLEPFDEEYRVDNSIKHLSYHAYLKKLQSESSLAKVLEVPDYKVNRNCKAGHAPWPASICSKCQPAAITLQQQRFRMVDHLEFANPSIVNNFIEYWRKSNTQRLGFMIGTYEPHLLVPLGIKAVVHAIYEPEQTGAMDGIAADLEPGPAVYSAAAALGMQIVGIVFTDLVDSGKGDGSVLCKRHGNSYFLSSLEAAFAANLQNKFASPSKYSDSGVFSSKFVTCVISGNPVGEIDMACYQVSVQAQSMVDADLIVPSTNPSVMRIKDPSRERYVPDIFYKRVNEYKLTVQENAKPAFPVDYLLVSLSHGFPDSPNESVSNAFTVENRPSLRSQTVSQLSDRLELQTGLRSDHLRDFHLLAYLFAVGAFQPAEIKLLTQLLAEEKADPSSAKVVDLATQLAHSPSIATLRVLAQH